MDVLQLARVRSLARNGTARRVREAAELSKAEVGGAVGVSGEAVTRWENGSRAPTGVPALKYLRLLERLSALTGVSLDEHTGSAA